MAIPGPRVRADGGPGAREAAALLPIVDRLISAVEARIGPKRAHRPLTVTKLWAAYDEAHAGPEWWRNVRSLLRPLVAEFGNHDVMALTRADWRRHIAARGLKRGSPAQLLRRVRSMLRWAKKERLLAQALEHDWFSVPIPKSPPPRRSEIRPEHVERMLALGKPVWSLFFSLAIDTSLRTSEVLSIRWEWLDLDAGRLRLPPEAVKTDVPRDVPLSSRSIDRLRRRRRRTDSMYVFASERTAGPMTRAWAYYHFKRLAEAVGVEAAPGDIAIHLHDARGTSAARVIRAGANLREVMAHLGVKSAKTADLYIQRFSEEDRDRHRELVEAASKGERVAKPRTG